MNIHATGVCSRGLVILGSVWGNLLKMCSCRNSTKLPNSVEVWVVFFQLTDGIAGQWRAQSVKGQSTGKGLVGWHLLQLFFSLNHLELITTLLFFFFFFFGGAWGRLFQWYFLNNPILSYVLNENPKKVQKVCAPVSLWVCQALQDQMMKEDKVEIDGSRAQLIKNELGQNHRLIWAGRDL